MHLLQLNLWAFHNTISLYSLRFTIIWLNLFILWLQAKSLRCCNFVTECQMSLNGILPLPSPYFLFDTLMRCTKCVNYTCRPYVCVFKCACSMCMLVYVYVRLCVCVFMRACRHVCVLCTCEVRSRCLSLI